MSQWYCSLQDALDEMGSRTNNGVENKKLFEKIRQVSRRIDGLFQQPRPMFLPYVEDRKIRASGQVVNSYDNTLRLPTPLLALNSVTQGTTPLTVGSQVEAWVSGVVPYHYLRLLDYGLSWYRDCGCASPAPTFITVNGTWGYHSDYDEAWLLTTTLSADPSTGASITVADIDGTDGYGRSPWISPGALLKIEIEFLLVTAVNAGTNVATVKRGMNGTTAVAHAINTPVYVWQVEDTIRRATARQSAFLYARAGAYESSSVSDVGVVNYPSDLLAELRGIAQAFAYE